MDKRNEKPELDMFTLLNPDFYGVPEDQFINKTEKDTDIPDTDKEKEN